MQLDVLSLRFQMLELVVDDEGNIIPIFVCSSSSNKSPVHTLSALLCMWCPFTRPAVMVQWEETLASS